MPTLVSKLLRRPLGFRARRHPPVSSFTIFLLGFGLLFWMVVTFSVVTHTNCGMGYFWTTGWESKTSIFQTLMATIVLTVVVWFVRFYSAVKRGMIVEAALQGVFIAVVVVSFIGFRALLFPYGVPSYVDFFAAYERISPQRVRLLEERADINTAGQNWRYDYPPPPDVEFKSDPRFEPGFYKHFSEIFSRPSSPLPGEVKAARACMIDEKRSYEQYLKDRETLDKYWEAFHNWYALNKVRLER